MSIEGRLLIFIPTYNEAENVEALFDHICRLSINADILFLDDNSPDGTGQIIDRLAAANARVHAIHRPGKLGIGSAHATGIRWAYANGFNWLITMDCDFTHSPDRIPDFVSAAGQHDVVIGSRYLQAGSLRSWNLLRKLLTRTGHLLTKTFLRMPYDATGAFRVYRLDRIPAGLFSLIYSRSYSFFFESLYVLWLNGFEIKEIPLDLPARTYGHSKMAWRDALHSTLLLIYLFFKTSIDRTSLLHRDPFNACSESLPSTTAQQEWDAYWFSKSNASALVYDVIAAFYRKFIIRRILDHFIIKHFPARSKLLHAGCGSGQVDVHVVERSSVSALDISTQALTLYHKFNPGAEDLIHGSVFDIPVPDESFDGIYNLGVMEHFTEEEIHRVLNEFHRVLKPGGKIALFWPPSFGVTVRFLTFVHWLLRKVGKTDVKLHPDEITHVRSRAQVRSYLDAGGFSLVDFYFGARDLFTQAVIVGQKASFAERAINPAAAQGSIRMRDRLSRDLSLRSNSKS
jgi:dolichol-phosphate mannosyltransferase